LAERCSFCKALEPLYGRLFDQYGGRMVFAKLIVDEPQNQELARRAAVEGTPTRKFYCRRREVGEHVGYAMEPVLRKKTDEMLAEIESCLANSTPLEG
jgi:thioredoxin-like negative regulator of GroEL